MCPLTFDLAEAEVDLPNGTELEWSGFAMPIPENVLIFTSDTQKFKRGDGHTNFIDLPPGPSLDGIRAGELNTVNVLVGLLPANDGQMIVIDSELYKASTTTVTAVSSRLTAAGSKDNVQDSNMDAVSSQSNMVDTSATAADNGKMAIIGNHKMTPGVLPASLGIAAPNPANPLVISSVLFYSDLACTVPVTKLGHNQTFYAKVSALHDSVDNDLLSYAFDDNNANTTITTLGRGIFRIVVANVNGVDVVSTFTTTVTYSTKSATMTKNMSITAYNPILLALYGTTSYGEQFNGTAVNQTNGNIVAVGMTAGEGAGTGSCLIMLFDSNLNILARKVYYGASQDLFSGVTFDSAGNIIAVGQTGSEGPGSTNQLIVKFDSSLNILFRKVHGYVGKYGNFHDVVTDASDNIYVVGSISWDGGNGILIKFDTSLNVLATRMCNGSTSPYEQLDTMAIDSMGNIICVGYTQISGYNHGLIIKFDSSLNLTYATVLKSSDTTHAVLSGVCVDSNDNVIVTGYASSAVDSSIGFLIYKLDQTLVVISGKCIQYNPSAGVNTMYSVGNLKADAQNNFYAIFYLANDLGTITEGIVKFDSSLNVVMTKKLSGIDSSFFTQLQHLTLDSVGNIIVVGTSKTAAATTDALVAKIPPAPSAGTVVGLVITTIKISDLTTPFTVIPATLTVTPQFGFSINQSNWTLTNSALTLINSAAIFTQDAVSP